MQAFRVVANAAGANAQDPEIENARRTVLTYSGWIVFGGFLGAIGAFAVYFFGFLLATSVITVGLLMYNHSSSYDAVFNNTCCLYPQSGFGTMRTLCIINLIGSIVGAVISIIAIAFHYRNSSAIWVVFGVVALIACIISGIASAKALSPLGLLQKKMREIDDRVKAGAIAVVATTGTVQQAQPVVQTYPYPAEPYATQPVQQAQYGQAQAQPAYGQPAYNNTQPQGYPQQQQQQQPAYGQPGYDQQPTGYGQKNTSDPEHQA